MGRPELGFPHTLLIPTAAMVGLVWLWVQTPTPHRANALVPLVVGLVVWTLVEYLLHRYLLHRVQPFNAWHLHHHRHPEVPMQTPVVFSLVLVLALASLPALLSANQVWALPLSAGLIAGHGLQEFVHFHLHQRRSPPQKTWFKSRWASHQGHHDQGGEHANFGTLTGFWDSVFRTREHPALD